MKDSERSGSHLFELTPDRDLIDTKFNGYKLSLDTIPVQTVDLCTAVDKVGPSDEQFSLLHVTLFSKANLIFPHPLWKNTVFYIDNNWDVFRAKINLQTDRLLTPLKVWTIPHSESKNVTGRYNVSLLFQENLALLADGCGRIFILQINESDDPWTEVFTGNFSSALVENKSFCLIDARCYNGPNADFIDILSLQIDETAHWKDKLESHEDRYLPTPENAFVSVLQWNTLIIDGNNCWTIKSSRTVIGRKGINYASIEPDGSAIYLASDGPFYMVEDSENPIVLSTEKVKAEVTAEKEEETDVATETVNDQPQQGLGGDKEKEAERIMTDTFNNQQLEECDLFPADTAMLMRMDKARQNITHQASLGSHQWLFSTHTTYNKVPAICVRFDVDGMIWQPEVESASDGGNEKKFHCKHIGTFSAIGYVQASKVHRKFTECAPDLSYVAICEASRHIYIYRQPAQVENQLLRNRK